MSFTAVFIALIFLAMGKPPVNPPTTDPPITKDQLQAAIDAKFAKASFTTTLPDVDLEGYQLPANMLNSSPYLVGRLVNIEESNGKTKIDLIGDLDYLINANKLSSSMVSSAPFFNDYVTKSVHTNVSAVMGIAASLSDSESVHVTYQTILSSTPQNQFLDRKQLEADNVSYGLQSKWKNPKIVYSVTVNRLTYQKFRQFSGGITGSNLIVNLNGGMYYSEGTEVNIYEVYITVADPVFPQTTITGAAATTISTTPPPPPPPPPDTDNMTISVSDQSALTVGQEEEIKPDVLGRVIKVDEVARIKSPRRH